MNYIVTKRKDYFAKIGKYNYADLTIFKDKIKYLKEIAIDTETTSLKFYKGEMFSLQVGTGTDNFLFDLETISVHDTIPLIIDKILVFHNAAFDLTWFYKYNYFPWKVRDTFLASKILYNGLPYIRHGFGFVMERELNIHYDKSEQKNIALIKLSTNRAIQYCFNDVDKLLELKKVLHTKIYKGGFAQVYNLHCKWIRAFAYMQTCGIPINEDKWKEKIKEDKKELKTKSDIVSHYIYDHLPKYRETQLSLFDTEKKINVSITSPLQMISVFEDLGINVEDKDKKSGKSISENIINKTKHEFVDIWLDYQSINHDVTTFGENFLPSIYQGRLYTSYSPILDTARISAGGKNKQKGEIDDVNTLNIPANQKSREPFEAKKGYKYLVADYEGQIGIVL